MPGRLKAAYRLWSLQFNIASFKNDWQLMLTSLRRKHRELAALRKWLYDEAPISAREQAVGESIRAENGLEKIVALIDKSLRE